MRLRRSYLGAGAGALVDDDGVAHRRGLHARLARLAAVGHFVALKRLRLLGNSTATAAAASAAARSYARPYKGG